MTQKNQTLVKLENAGVLVNEKWLVRGVSLEIKKGKIITLIGPNGSGKSTTAKITLGLYKNIEGRVEKFTNKIAYVPQKINIDWTLPIRVNDFMNLTSNLKKEEVETALEITGTPHLKNKDLKSLSGGEFQRVLMARAIAKKPELLVLDEPVQGVDFNGEIALYELIKKISDTLNCGILLISHNLHVVMSKTDHVVCLNGHVCCSGTPIDVANNEKYQELFGKDISKILSVYEHSHDHIHNIDGTIEKKSDKTQLIIDDCREIDNLKLLIINLESSQASDVRVQNTLRNCLTKFKPDKDRCGIKIPVLAAVRNKNSVTYVKFGEQFCVGDIQGVCKLLEDKSFKVNLKSLVS